MPHAERAREPDDDVRVQSQPPSQCCAIDVGAELRRIDAIRIDNNLLVFDTGLQKISALNFGHDKDARRSFQVQTLIARQQIQFPNPIPISPHPNFRAIVFEK